MFYPKNYFYEAQVVERRSCGKDTPTEEEKTCMRKEWCSP
jgi:hypothetical protein